MSASADTRVPAEASLQASHASQSVLLSPELSTAASRPLRHWRESDRALLSNRVMEATRRWAREWRLPDRSGPGALPAFEARREAAHGRSGAWSQVPRRWQDLASSRATGVQWALSVRGHAAASPVAVLRQALYGRSRSAKPGHDGLHLADEMAQLAWDDWLDAMTKTLVPAQDGEEDSVGSTSARALPTPRSRPWDGALPITLNWFGHEMDLLLSHDAVLRCVARERSLPPQAAPAPPPVPLLQALGRYALPLSVELAPFDVALGALTGLKVGDVLSTGHPLSTPLQVRAGTHDRTGAPLCSAFLGRVGSRRAIELVQAASPARRPHPHN